MESNVCSTFEYKYLTRFRYLKLVNELRRIYFVNINLPLNLDRYWCPVSSHKTRLKTIYISSFGGS